MFFSKPASGFDNLYCCTATSAFLGLRPGNRSRAGSPAAVGGCRKTGRRRKYRVPAGRARPGHVSRRISPSQGISDLTPQKRTFLFGYLFIALCRQDIENVRKARGTSRKYGVRRRTTNFSRSSHVPPAIAIMLNAFPIFEALSILCGRLGRDYIDCQLLRRKERPERNGPPDSRSPDSCWHIRHG